MVLRFTRHAVARMLERDITSTDINEIFKNKYLAFERKGYTIIGKTNKDKYITMVQNLKKKTIITLWPSKRKERKLYEEKITKI